MTRHLFLLAATVLAAPALAQREPPYYGPAVGHGLQFKYGYDDKAEKDGRWRITATVRHGKAIDMAMYRAAERARDSGYRYVQFLRGTASRMPGIGFATVWARPAATPAAPPGCERVALGACYTADVAAVMRVLGGPNGTQPGVAIVDHYDQFARPVTLSGFGVGAVDGRATAVARTTDGRLEIRLRGAVPAPLPAAGPASAVRTPLSTTTSYSAPTVASGPVASPPLTAADEARTRFDEAMRSQRGTRGRDARQGWTVSD